MGRRSDHTPQQLRDLLIDHGHKLMAEVGYARFSGREVAKRAGYSVGTIYNVFGSLDGASKFVKGDAVAGLLITALNLVMGLVIGTVIHDMPIGQAFETYAILTVGDGLVSQIPAVVISIASALLLARGGAKGATDLAVFNQL